MKLLTKHIENLVILSKMIKFSLQFLFLVALIARQSNALAGEPKIRCIGGERRALLKIKESLHELKDGFLSSWGDEEEKHDCCEWQGIQCSNRSGHVTALDLSPTYWQPQPSFLYGDYQVDEESRFLRGNFSTSLLDLKQLTILDLSVINFEGNGIPSFIGMLRNLRYLNLSYTLVRGEIPPQLGNLSSLEVLDIGQNRGLRTDFIGWLSGLSSLKSLDLTYTNMSQSDEWMRAVNSLGELNSLRLIDCDLPGSVVPSSHSHVNSSKSLSFLDLSCNNKLSVSVFPFVSSFSRSLVHLNLQHSILEGSISDALGNFTSLTYLNLCLNRLKGHIPNSLWNLTALEYLNLGQSKLEGFIPESIGNLKSLMYLNLYSNSLQGHIPRSLGNLTLLKDLFLGANKFTGLVPESLGNLAALVYLGLGLNKLEGAIPKGIGNLSSLIVLDLSYNNLEGEFPNSLWNLCSLSRLQAENNYLSGLQLPELTQSSPNCAYNSLNHLSLGQNILHGSLPEAIGQFSQLRYLDLAENSLTGVISEAHFAKLSKLSTLYLSDNSLVLNFTHDGIPPFKLGIIGLNSCKLGPKFPKWLQTQKGYAVLSLSNAGISDSIPDWFWDVSTNNCFSMDLSDNQIHGQIPNPAFEFKDYPKVKLSSNKLEGSIPNFLFKVGALDLSRNRFSDLNSLCDVSEDSALNFLDLSFNHLSGILPNCWSPFKELSVLVLGNNKLSGRIPVSIGSLAEIRTLNFGNNYFTQDLPSSIRNCKKLMAINVGENRLSGRIPVGESLTSVIVLSLRSNNFCGEIPLQLCHLSSLQLLDLSLNSLSGGVPKCVHNLTAMKKSWDGIGTDVFHIYTYGTSSGSSATYTGYKDKVDLVWKGTLSKFGNTLGLVKYIDLSSNKLMGNIPIEIGELYELVFLNLSRNNLSGQIPSEIGRLSLLDTLDLSNNQLSGGIPSSLSQVARLNTLDLSNNKLSGKIPTSTQLQSFESASYAGNPQLCGKPLPNDWSIDERRTSHTTMSEDERYEDDQDAFISGGFYVSVGIGFVGGFWGVCGFLIFKKTLRYSLFNVLTDVKDWAIVMVLIHKARFLRRISKSKRQ